MILFAYFLLDHRWTINKSLARSHISIRAVHQILADVIYRGDARLCQISSVVAHLSYSWVYYSRWATALVDALLVAVCFFCIIGPVQKLLSVDVLCQKRRCRYDSAKIVIIPIVIGAGAQGLIGPHRL